MTKLIKTALIVVINLAATITANPLAGGRIVPSVTSFPFMASLQLKKYSTNFCGCSIIDKRNVLTAAHCYHMYPEDPKVVVVGITNIAAAEDSDKYDIEFWAPHKDFVVDSISGANDIAVARVSKDFVFAPGQVQFISLDLNNLVRGITVQDIYLVGFGPTGNQCHERTNLLHWLPSKILSRANYFAQNYPNEPGLENRLICTYGSDRLDCLDYSIRFAACKGDSGGPVVAVDPKTGKFILIGVIVDGNEVRTHVVKVHAYLDWIVGAKIKLTMDNLSSKTLAE